MKKLFKLFFMYLLFGPLFHKEPFFRWIVAGIISPPKIFKKKYKNKLFKYNISSTDVYRFVKLFWWSSNREIETRNWFEKNLMEDDIFLNIGAHIGTFVVFANKIKKLKKTICIEASSSNVSELMINLNINNIQNTDIFHCAAGDREGFVEFTYERLNPGYYNGRALDLHYSQHQKHPKQGSEYIQMKKIDSLIKDNNLPSPNIILMDIDGHELLALKGMNDIFSSSSLRWAIIETNSKTEDFVKNFMFKHDFNELSLKGTSNNGQGPTNRVFVKNKI